MVKTGFCYKLAKIFVLAYWSSSPVWTREVLKISFGRTIRVPDLTCPVEEFKPKADHPHWVLVECFFNHIRTHYNEEILYIFLFIFLFTATLRYCFDFKRLRAFIGFFYLERDTIILL
jgi:hypothetical protein